MVGFTCSCEVGVLGIFPDTPTGSRLLDVSCRPSLQVPGDLRLPKLNSSLQDGDCFSLRSAMD